MANNNYGPPPPMMNSHPPISSSDYYPPQTHQQQQQQQHQSERISGDGEEVYGRYGYNNFLRQAPAPQQGGPPMMMSMIPQPQQPPAAAPPQHLLQGPGQGVGYGYDPTQQQPLPSTISLAQPPPMLNNVYDQYDYSNASQSQQSLPLEQQMQSLELQQQQLQGNQDNRSVDGEEQYLGYSNGGSSGPPAIIHDLVPDARSIEGQEQDIRESITAGQGQGGSGHGSNASSTANPPLALLSSHQRSETLGSDTIVDEPRHPPTKSKSMKGGGNHNNSGSETGESVGISTRGGDGRRKKEIEKGKGKGHRDYDRDVSHGHSRRFSSEYEDESEEDDFERRQRRGRRERDRDFGDHRSSQRSRGTGAGGIREVDRERSRREWETSRDAYTAVHSRHRREYDEDEYERPRSRSSYHNEEYYSTRRRRRGESDSYKPRGPPSEYNPSSRVYPRDTRPPYGYMDYPPSSASFTVGRNQFVPTIATGFDSSTVTSQTQSFQLYLASFRTKYPAEYREWYHKYLAHLQDPVRISFPPVRGFPGAVGQPSQSTGTIEKSRPPSQSGRSSVVDEAIGIGLGSDDPRFKSIKENQESTLPSRNTPLIFSTPHAIGNLSALGCMIRNRYGSPNVEVVTLKSLTQRLPEYKEIKSFPGPLIKGVTHKNTIVQFCQRKIRDLEVNDNQLDRENLILLWELLILLLRQNGSAIGSDIAELLLKSKSAGQSLDSAGSEQESSGDENHVEDTRKGKSVNNIQNFRTTNDQHLVDEFCQKLIFGHKREALEYAMDNALWGHALCFASKMDEKLFGTVLAKFSNETMTLNSPLQTLYHVLSGKQPPSVTCCGDESFGDWKPHLAMLLSNMGQRPEFEANTMRTLGRTLANRKLKFASQFCYLMAESEFVEGSDIGPLLGYNPNTRNILEATQMTEIYEFARSLANPEFSLGASFIESKFNYTKQLINFGFVQEAYSYCEEMTKMLRKHRVHVKEQTLAKNILYIAERLVNCDVTRGSGEPTWIEDLRKISDEINSETTSRKLSLATSTSDHIDDSSSNIHVNHNPYSTENHNFMQNDGASENLSVPPLNPINNMATTSGYMLDNINSNQWNQQPPQSYPSMTPNNRTPEISNFQPNFQIGNGPLNPIQDNNNYWPHPEQPSKFNSGPGDQNFSTGLKKRVVHFEDEELNGDAIQSLKDRQLDNLTSKANPPQSSFNDEQYRQNSKPQPVNKPEKKGSDKLPNNQGKKKKGWLSGMFGNIFEQKNQMILPDDKEPTMVWDEATKTWKNTKGDDDEDSAPKGPPPKDSDLMGMGGAGLNPSSNPHYNTPAPNAMMSHQNSPQQPPNNGLPNQPNSIQNQHPVVKMNGGPATGLGPIQNQPQASGANKFQRPKGLKLRNNYVDVFNPNVNAQQKAEAPTVPLSATAPSPGLPNIFMPPPAAADAGPISFLSEGGNYTEEGQEAQVAAPPMFNPAQFQNQNIPNYGLNR